MQPISQYVLQLRRLRLQHLRPFRWFCLASLYAAVISLIHGVQTWQHYMTFQEMGFASSHNSSWLSKLIAWSSMPGALPAYLVGSFSQSIALVIVIYLLGMGLVYGGLGLLVDVLSGLIRYFRSHNYPPHDHFRVEAPEPVTDC